ncbi:MAG: hypothetical protein K2K17_11505, partial [Lachnospiraceae bacterium]|nr:hypothetical protein [Lachnospiraceae bacterium]
SFLPSSPPPVPPPQIPPPGRGHLNGLPDQKQTLEQTDTDQMPEHKHMQCIQMIEFEYAEEYEEQIFALEPLCGRGTLEFIFLPGSSFDFKEFQFLKEKENG